MIVLTASADTMVSVSAVETYPSINPHMFALFLPEIQYVLTDPITRHGDRDFE